MTEITSINISQHEESNLASLFDVLVLQLIRGSRAVIYQQLLSVIQT